MCSFRWETEFLNDILSYENKEEVFRGIFMGHLKILQNIPVYFWWNKMLILTVCVPSKGQYAVSCLRLNFVPFDIMVVLSTVLNTKPFLSSFWVFFPTFSSPVTSVDSFLFFHVEKGQCIIHPNSIVYITQIL